MIPKILKKGDNFYKLIKVYKNHVLYENINTGIKECFTKFQLGLVKEIVKPHKEARKGGACKH